MWEQQVICGQGRPALCQSFLSFLPVLSIHRHCFLGFFDGVGHMQGNALTKIHTHADQHALTQCVQQDLESDSMFRSVEVQVCRKEKRQRKNSPVSYFLCFYFN